MRAHPKIRKTIKWGGAAVTLLLVVVWIGSGWWRIFCQFIPTQGELMISDGRVEVEYFFRAGWGMPGTQIEGPHPKYHAPFWWFSQVRAPNVWSVSVPLWAPICMTLAACALAWRLDSLARRRARGGLCPKCNYDRAGLAVGAKCPECGSLPA